MGEEKREDGGGVENLNHKQDNAKRLALLKTAGCSAVHAVETEGSSRARKSWAYTEGRAGFGKSKPLS